jgi:hypothetical protein
MDEQLSKLDQMIAEKQAALIPMLTVANDTLKQLVDDASGTGGLSLEQLGRQLPVNSLFR